MTRSNTQVCSRAPLLILLGLAMAAPVLPASVSPAYAQDDAGDGDGEVDENQPEDGASTDASDTASDPAPSAGSDVDALRQEYLRLRDELFRSRARAAAVASAMYSTRVRIFLTYGSGRFHAVTRATIRLDGANVYDDASGAVTNDGALRFEGFVAPGRHVISIRIEATSKDDERFTSTSEHTFTIQAPAGKDVIVTAKAQDKGNIAYAWKKKEKGSYQPSLSVSVKTEKRADAPPKAAATTSKRDRDEDARRPKTRARISASASGGSRAR